VYAVDLHGVLYILFLESVSIKTLCFMTVMSISAYLIIPDENKLQAHL
jgi:hypothetical protein